VTIARRVDAIEAALDPTARVLRWLAEAHAFDSFERYIEATLTAGGEMPLDRLVRESIAAVRTQRQGPAETEKGVQVELRSTVVRFFIVLRINKVTAQALEREVLLRMTLTAHLLLSTERGARQLPELRSDRLRDLAVGRVGELHALRDARATNEQRFLGGEQALFPSARRQWDPQVAQTDLLARMAVRQVELDGGEPIDGNAAPGADRAHGAVHRRPDRTGASQDARSAGQWARGVGAAARVARRVTHGFRR
jgi:hypothetical protein